MLTDQEIGVFRQDIIENMSFETDITIRFSDTLRMAEKVKALAKQDHAAFLDLCTKLLMDEDKEVRLGLLHILSHYAQREPVLTQLLIGSPFMDSVVEDKALLNETLCALARIGTRDALPTLYRYALTGSECALRGFGWLVRTEREVQVAIRIARTYLTSPEYSLRETALFLLQRRSAIEKEEELILEAVRLYKDELFIEALREATPQNILPRLKEIAATLPERSAEFDDLSKAIAILEQRMEKE